MPAPKPKSLVRLPKRSARCEPAKYPDAALTPDPEALVSAGPRAIVERRHRTKGQRPLDTALDGLMVCTHGPPHRKKRRVYPVGQQHPRSPDPARRFRSRAGDRAQRRQILLANRQFDRLPLSRHDLKPRFRIKAARLQAMSGKMNPAHMIGFTESMN
jgi:hypothetical protein